MLPPPPQLGWFFFANACARFWKKRIPRCSPSESPVPSGSPKPPPPFDPGFMLQLGPQSALTVGARHGASKTLPVRTAGRLVGILDAAVHFTPSASGVPAGPACVLKEPATPLKAVLGHPCPLFPELAETLTELLSAK